MHRGAELKSRKRIDAHERKSGNAHHRKLAEVEASCGADGLAALQRAAQRQ
jgi:hypothetical protein